MISFLLGLATLIVALVLIRAYVKANPKALALGFRASAGWAALGLAFIALTTGRVGGAVVLGVIGLGLLGYGLTIQPHGGAAGGREHMQGDARGRGGRGGMSVDEALEVLGLKAHPSLEQIREAHRTLIKKLHPDQGGSTHLAARVNEAKDVLIRHYRDTPN